MKAWKQREKMKMVKFEFSLKFIYVFCTPSVIPSRKYKLKGTVKEKSWNEKKNGKRQEYCEYCLRIIHDVQGVPRNMTVGE